MVYPIQSMSCYVVRQSETLTSWPSDQDPNFSSRQHTFDIPYIQLITKAKYWIEAMMENKYSQDMQLYLSSVGFVKTAQVT